MKNNYVKLLDEQMILIKNILTKDQLNIIYLGACIKDIENNLDYDFADDYIPVKTYIEDLITVMERKEEYEICANLQLVLSDLN